MARQRRGSVLWVFLMVGFVLGGIAGELLGSVFPLLSRSVSVGLDPSFHLDLHLFQFTLGFLFRVNLMSIVGVILGIILYRWL